MRARVYDPTAKPWLARGAPLMAGALALVAFAPVESPSFRVRAFFAAVAILLGLPPLVRSGFEREARLELSPGLLRVFVDRDVAVAVRSIAVTAAATSEKQGKWIVSIDRRGEDRPLCIEVEREEDARAIHEALGLGDGDVGALTIRAASPFDRVGRAARVIAASFAALLAIFAQDEPMLALPFAGLTVALLVLLFATVVGKTSARSPSIVLNREALWARGDRRIPLANVENALAVGGTLRVVERGGAEHAIATKLAPREVDELAVHVVARAKRAGEGALAKPELPQSVAALAQAGEPARSWFARLDDIARTIANGAGYREAGVNPDELWGALRDPEAPADVRAAAARILLRVDPESAPKRVEDVLATAHDRMTRERIRIATDDDIDAAARDLDAIDHKSS